VIRKSVCILAAALLAGAPARAQHDHDHTHPAGSVKAELVAPATHQAGKTASTIIRLTGKEGKPLTLDQLQVAHTEKLHLLVIDETLTDYHHEHPVAAEKPGEYRFDFSPRHGGTYHIWADIVPTATGQQEYVETEVKVQGAPAKKDKALNTTATAEAYRFSLTTEKNEPLRVGTAAMVTVKVTSADGKDFTGLEPVMGAFAHMVAFPEDLASVMHVHPMGKEPQTPNEHGGPELAFHVEPAKAGFHKMFLQVQIGGREVYAAFGLEVKPGSSAVSPQPSFPSTAAYVCPMHPGVKQDAPGKCPKCGMPLVKK
jgi:hypothetical protein